jgi:hypothetical protein
VVVGAVILVAALVLALVLARQPLVALVLALCAATVAWAIARERQGGNRDSDGR